MEVSLVTSQTLFASVGHLLDLGWSRDPGLRRKEFMEIYFKTRWGVPLVWVVDAMAEFQGTRRGGWKAGLLLGFQPGLRFIVIVDELIII